MSRKSGRLKRPAGQQGGARAAGSGVRGARHDSGENTQVVRAVGQIGGLTLLSRISGLGRDMVIGYVFGAGLAADAFFVAFRIPNLLRRLVGEGATDAAFVPVLTRYLSRRSRATSRMIRAFFGTGLGLLLVLTGLGICLADPLTRLFAPGFTSDKLLLTIDLTRVMFVYLFCVGAAALAMGVLHALRHFTAPAFAPVLFNAAVIVSVFGLSAQVAEPVMSLAYGVVLGGVCQLLWQLPALVRHGVSLRLSWQPCHPALRRMGLLLLPLVFGTGIFQLNQIISTLLASLLADGSVACLWYASRLFEFPVGIFVVALSTAVLPSLATYAQQHDWAGMRDSLGFALRLVNVVTLPAAVGLAVLATPVTTVLFFRGAFSAQDVVVTATALQALALGLWAVAATRQVTACLYALGDTRTPVWGGVVALMIKIGASLVLMGRISLPSEANWLAQGVAAVSGMVSMQNWGVVGLAAATSLASMANLVFQAVRLSRRLSAFPWRQWAVSLLWSGLASVGMLVVLWWFVGQIDWLAPGGSRLSRLGSLGGAVLIGVCSFVVLVWPGGKDELRALLGILPHRLLGLLPQFLQPRQ